MTTESHIDKEPKGQKIIRSLSEGNLCKLSYDEARSVRGYNEETTLHAAVAGGSLKNVKKLMVMVDIDSTDIDGKRPLHVACMTERVSAKIVKSLASNKKADIDSRNSTKNTPLHFACQTESIEKVKILVKKGANIDARNEDGDTPLLVAGKAQAIDVVRYLLEMGADAKLANKERKTIYDVAKEFGFSDMLDLVCTKTKSVSTKKQRNISESDFSNFISNEEASLEKLTDDNKHNDDNEINKTVCWQLDNLTERLNQLSMRLDRTESKTDQVFSTMSTMKSEFESFNKKRAKQSNKKDINNDISRALETTEEKLKKIEEQFALFSKNTVEKANLDLINNKTVNLTDLVDSLKSKQAEYDKKLTDAYKSLENTQNKINQINEKVNEEQRKTNKMHDSVTECTAKTESLLQSQTHIEDSISCINNKFDGTLRDMELVIKENEAKLLELKNMQAKIEAFNEHKEIKVIEMQRELTFLKNSMIHSNKDKLNSEIMKLTQKVRRSSLPLLDNQLSRTYTEVIANCSIEMPKTNVKITPKNKALFTTSSMSKNSQEDTNHAVQISLNRKNSLNKTIISEYSEMKTSTFITENYEEKTDNSNQSTASNECVKECVIITAQPYSSAQTNSKHQQNTDKCVQIESAKRQQNRQRRNSQDFSTNITGTSAKKPSLPSSTASNNLSMINNVQTEKPKSAKMKGVVPITDNNIALSTSVKMKCRPSESKLISIDNLQTKNSLTGRQTSPEESCSKSISLKQNIHKSTSPKEICTGCQVYKGNVKKRPDCDHFRCDSCELNSRCCLKCNHPFRKYKHKPPSTPAMKNIAKDDCALLSDQYLYTEKYDRQEDDSQIVLSNCNFYHSAAQSRRPSNDIHLETKAGHKNFNCYNGEGTGCGNGICDNFESSYPQHIKYCRNNIRKSPPSVHTLVPHSSFVKRTPPATMEKDCSGCFLPTTKASNFGCDQSMCENCLRDVKTQFRSFDMS